MTKQLPYALPATSDVQAQFQRVAGRDFELWGIGLFLTTALMLGLLAVVACTSWRATPQLTSSLPQLVVGLVAPVILLNAYLVTQKRSLQKATDLIIKQVASDNIARRYSFIDTDTQVFTR